MTYTCLAGFIDVAHVRHGMDLTRFYYDQLSRNRTRGTLLYSYEGIPRLIPNIAILEDIPDDKVLGVAQHMAWTELLFHEIDTYWWQKWMPGGHNSSFSPEDLVSNLVGVFLGGGALEALAAKQYPTFDDAAADMLVLFLQDVGGRDGARTEAAYQKIENIWYEKRPPFPWLLPFPFPPFPPSLRRADTHLKRRNFGLAGDVNVIDPWFVAGVPGCPPQPQFPEAIPKRIPGEFNRFYSAIFASGLLNGHFRLIQKHNYPIRVDEIISDAKALYGPNADKPDP
jgi:hypothetical protein